MEARNETLKFHQHAGSVFRIWSGYWCSLELPIPPIHFLCPGASNDLFFVVGIGNSELFGFLDNMQKNSEFQFIGTGDWLLSPYEWLGHWNCFIATSRKTFK
jgi:hypothetical protein